MALFLLKQDPSRDISLINFSFNDQKQKSYVSYVLMYSILD